MGVVRVRDLDLDLDGFEGPFDLLLTVILKEELELADVEIAEIVLAFVDRLLERGRADLEACGEFLVLVATLLELKARELFQEEEELEELDPDEAADELAERLATYRRFQAAAEWLEERLARERDRFFRLGPAPLALEPPRSLAPQAPEKLAEALRALAAEPPEPSLLHLDLTFPPVGRFLARFRAVLRRDRVLVFDSEVERLSRAEQAVALLALLELRRAGEIRLGQQRPFTAITAWSA